MVEFIDCGYWSEREAFQFGERRHDRKHEKKKKSRRANPLQRRKRRRRRRMFLFAFVKIPILNGLDYIYRIYMEPLIVFND